ncbi:MAG: polyprenyl synthetase family protein [Alphaproteobacteria bacterium]|nr:polyprenyl synthetase family protein [Alphaproteobacteria bacterium]
MISTSIATRLDMNPLSELALLFSDKIKHVDTILQENAYSEVSVLPLISSHIIESGGKRIRPLLTLAAAQLCGDSMAERAVTMAACVEFLHTATLLHDDVVDESLLRRGKPTAHTLWGNQMSVLTGDFLFAKLFELLVQDGSLDILNLFVLTTQKIIEGEVLQISAKATPFVSRDDYFAIIQSKTAVLFETALELGGRVAKGTVEQIQGLKSYAHNLGMAFQLIDDVLDYTADESGLGKPIGNDFFEGQVTLPLIILLERMADASKSLEKFRETMIKIERDSADLRWVQILLSEYSVIPSIKILAEEYADKARYALEIFPESPLKDILVQLTHFVINRCN